MITVAEYIYETKVETLAKLSQQYDLVPLQRVDDPEDDPTFRYFDRLMREVPRRG